VDDERQQDMGLELDYNAAGLIMSNNVSLYIGPYTRSCTKYVQAVSINICPNSLQRPSHRPIYRCAWSITHE